MKRIFTHCLLFLVSIGYSWAQSPISSSIDSTEIKIGAAVHLTIKAQVSDTDNVVFPNTPMMGPFEVIDHTPIDTVLQDRKMELIKKYTLTQFDSGKYTLPRLSVLVNGKNYQTDFYEINVHNVAVDTLKQPMYDIKDTIGGTTDTSKIIWYIIGAIICVLAGVVTYFIIKKRQEKNLTEDDLYRTPLEKVTKHLQFLDAKRLVMNGDVKSYYSELTDVIRDYIEEVFEIPAKESTTSEVIQLLLQTIKTKKIKLSKDTIQELKRVLETADLVKFAKSEPMIHEIEQDRKSMDQVSVTIDQAIPKFAEEQSERVRLREMRFKKRKQLRTWLPIGITAASFLVLGIVYVVQLAKDGFEINWFQSNKSLYEQEWVTSDYGYPALLISSPEILERKVSNVNNQDNLKNQAATFTYLNPKTNLGIVINTAVAETKETDLELLAKNKIQIMEQTYLLKNVLSQHEKFTQEGFEGIRSFGTYQLLSDNKTLDMEFEQFVFVQETGVQDLWISYPKGDEFGKKIAQRIIESIQLNVMKTNE